MWGGQKPLQLTVQPLETGCRLLVDRSIWSPWPQCSFLTHLIVRRWQVRGGRPVDRWPVDRSIWFQPPICTWLYMTTSLYLSDQSVPDCTWVYLSVPEYTYLYMSVLICTWLYQSVLVWPICTWLLQYLYYCVLLPTANIRSAQTAIVHNRGYFFQSICFVSHCFSGKFYSAVNEMLSLHIWHLIRANSCCMHSLTLNNSHTKRIKICGSGLERPGITTEFQPEDKLVTK